ncbi:META domain-containing protein [Dysgonomonas sp. HDW5B]|uniref:META domain-containing protein n=1 Tax=Dysgonomonas sp. HDW5B TaxID=2714927 RepID=UPI00140B794F|nr:META domain-containing protein [Dysgonomonas sp. HDW5B]QIK54007.1 META domain-containing protein [Dysgonomonas sp. HDW5B]
MSKILIYILSCFLLYSLGACSSWQNIEYTTASTYNSPNSPSIIPQELTSIKWALLNVRANSKETFIIPSLNNILTLSFKEEGRFNGYSSCNSFFGEVVVEKNSIEFRQITSTQRGCARTMEVEETIFKALREVDNYTIQNRKLFLKKNSNILLTYSLAM